MHNRLFISPEFDNAQSACDILNRISWGLYGLEKGAVDIYFVGQSAEKQIQLSEWLKHPTLSQSQDNYLPELPPLQKTPSDIQVEPGDVGLCWDSSTYSSRQGILSLKQKILIDPAYQFNYEADQVAALQYSISSEELQHSARNRSRASYAKFTNRFTNVENAYLYLTGPTVETALQGPVDRNALHIICNSLVKNEALLEKLQPDVLMFSDPAYHFGVSRYAASFRNYVRKTIESFPNLLCMVPERYLPLTGSFLGEEKRDRIIGLPVIEMDHFNFPSVENFYIRKTANILTLMMVPVASSLAQKIYILGADGRAINDKGYWQHAQSSQISDQMKTIYDSHPSLARDEDVEKYYFEHCQVLEEQFEYGEKVMGKQYINQTPSLIPALKNRAKRS